MNKRIYERLGVAIVIGILLILILGNVPACSQPRQVDVVMAIGLDNSGSMNPEELRLQVDGMAKAVINPEIIRIMTGGRHGAIAIRLYSWSQGAVILSDWIVVGNTADALRLYDIMMSQEFYNMLYGRTDGQAPNSSNNFTAAPRPIRSTNLDDAINTGVAIVRDGTYFGDRQVINIIGDGKDNIGDSSSDERDYAYYEYGIMINGLVMTEEAYDYYEESVVTPNGFTILVPDYPSFSKAMEEKFRDEMVYLLESIEEEYEHG